MLWALDGSLSAPADFNALVETLSHPLLKLVIWAVVSALIYHALAGIKHLIMDMGFGETMAAGILGVRIVWFLAAILIVFAGIWIW